MCVCVWGWRGDRYLVEDPPDVEEQLPDVVHIPLPPVEALQIYLSSVTEYIIL